MFKNHECTVKKSILSFRSAILFNLPKRPSGQLLSRHKRSIYTFLIQHSHNHQTFLHPPVPISSLNPHPSPPLQPPYSPSQARKIPLPTHPLAPHRARRPLRPPNLQAAIHARAARAQGDPPARQVPPRHHLDPIRRAPRARRIELHCRVHHRPFRAAVRADAVREWEGRAGGRGDGGVGAVSVLHALCRGKSDAVFGGGVIVE